MVAVGICLIKTPDADNVSPWPLKYNDLHTAAEKPAKRNNFMMVTGSDSSSCALCTGPMA